MNKQNSTAYLRLLEEVGICLRRLGFDTLPVEDQCLPIKWNDKEVCRVSGEGEILYDSEDVKRFNAECKLVYASPFIEMAAEYMPMMERAPQLKADGLTGDYRVLADFGNAVLAGHPTENGVQFITWEWTPDRKGVHQGKYFQEGYEEAKYDFVARSGILQENALFNSRQLLVIRNAMEFVLVENGKLVCGEEQEATNTMAQIEDMFMRKVPFGVEHLKNKMHRSRRAWL